MDVSIGARIKAARTAAGMTQMDVARRTDLSLQAVGDIERGIVRDPHISSLRQIAYALDVPVELLVKEEEADPAFPLDDASLEEPAVASLGKAETPDTGPSALAPWAAYARHVAAQTRSHTADPHSPAFRDAWAALFFVEERNHQAAELWRLLFEEELGWEAYADEPFAAFNAVLSALEELAEALAEAQRREEQMAAGIAESEIGQARRRTAEAVAQREQAAARGSSRLERRGA